ncbi:MAG: F0F1 ATP synthase subunit A [Elusimicrobia bacterium]|nr:F0F1 ATP synthase subunit A [Elusimicrobiota bacterium]
MSLVPEAIELHGPIPPLLVMSWIAWGGIGVLSLLARWPLAIIPRGIQNLFEALCEVVFDLADAAIGPEARRYYPLLLGIFLFVFFGNLLGLVPGFASPTSALNTTAALAVVVFVYYNYQGVRQHGLGYLKHFMGPPLPWYLFPINALIFCIELIGHVARPLSLAIRLFGNIFAKEVLLGILAYLVLVFLGLPNPVMRYSLAAGPLLLRPAIILLGALVSLIQAFVFLILSIIYVAGAVHVEHEPSHAS